MNQFASFWSRQLLAMVAKKWHDFFIHVNKIDSYCNHIPAFLCIHNFAIIIILFGSDFFLLVQRFWLNIRTHDTGVQHHLT